MSAPEEVNEWLETFRRSSDVDHESRQKMIDQHVGQSEAVVANLAAMNIQGLLNSPDFTK